MLGKFVRVAVDHARKGYMSKVGTSIYCGKILSGITNPTISNRLAYLISKEDPGLKSMGVVIAILNEEDPQGTRFVIAPRGYVYYEPEIREMISKIKNQPIHSIHCRYEKSCGAVVFNGNKDSLKFLIVRNKNATNWGFPKGHVERGENEYQTACREIKEETGLDVSIINGFREVSDYYSFGCAKKRVVFFLARSRTRRVTLQLEELNSYMWVTYEHAISMFEFRNNLFILKRAINFLNQRQLQQPHSSKRKTKK